MSKLEDKKPQTAETYDTLYETGGAAGAYHLDVRESPYLPLFRGTLDVVTSSGCQSVLDVGCGNGAFGVLAMSEAPSIKYSGFDFSAKAIDLAKTMSGNADVFSVGDAYDDATYRAKDYDCILCTEVLEHLEDDIGVVETWPEGTLCICSVPNFDSAYHCRHFATTKDVERRYADLIDIQSVKFISHPLVMRLRLNEYLRVWSRAVLRPRKLASLMRQSICGSDRGWFLFHGRRRRS